MSGDLNHGPIRADIARQQAQNARLITDDIVAAYAPQIAALDRPLRPMSSPD